MDAWVAVSVEAPVTIPAIEEGVTVGIGTMRTGIAGFVRSHQEAEQARAMIRVAVPGRIGPVVRFHDVQLVAMLTADLPAAREFVVARLGALADSGERAGELRETMLAFLEAGESYTAVAHTHHLHKNTVVQRVKRAAELMGNGDDHTLETHVALLLTSVLGERVLIKSS
ncbi:PucR family transcriptional regulator [Microbacterium sp. P5_E9]